MSSGMTPTENWNDGRLDDLARQVDRQRLDFKEWISDVDRRLHKRMDDLDEELAEFRSEYRQDVRGKTSNRLAVVAAIIAGICVVLASIVTAAGTLLA